MATTSAGAQWALQFPGTAGAPELEAWTHSLPPLPRQMPEAGQAHCLSPSLLSHHRCRACVPSALHSPPLPLVPLGHRHPGDLS